MGLLLSKIARKTARENQETDNEEINPFPITEGENNAVSTNGKNEAERKARFARLCMDDDTWQRVRQETDDAIHHRNMVQAELLLVSESELRKIAREVIPRGTPRKIK